MPHVNRRLAALLMLAISACFVAVFLATSSASENTGATCVEARGGTTCSEFQTGKPEPERDCEFREPGAAKKIIYLESSRIISCRRARKMLSEIPPGVRAPVRVQGPKSAWECREFSHARFPLISRCHRGRQHFSLESFGKKSKR